jgi:hypothetical protein
MAVLLLSEALAFPSRAAVLLKPKLPDMEQRFTHGNAIRSLLFKVSTYRRPTPPPIVSGRFLMNQILALYS